LAPAVIDAVAARPIRGVPPHSQSGYTLARVRYEILLSPQALKDFKALSARDRADVRSHLESHLRHEPAKTSRSRIKRLRGLSRPQYRLRVGEIRVFYDVRAAQVHVLTIVSKKQAEKWLRETGESE